MSLWILITLTMVIFIGLSFSRDIKIGDYILTKARFPEMLQKEDSNEEEIVVLPDTIEINEKENLIEPDTTVHNLLIFGDSMTHNLAMSIAKYGKKNNYKVTGVTWESSSIKGWSNSGKIREYLDSVKPDFVIISLGSNEMGLKDFERRLPDIRNIVEELGDLPFVWAGPPLWTEDKGLYKTLEKGLPKGHLFKIENLDIERGPDRIHPTRKGADQWADTLMRWIRRSEHPILTEVPDSGTTLRGNRFIYLHPDD